MSISIKNNWDNTKVCHEGLEEQTKSQAAEPIPERNIDVKKSMAMELWEIGLSKAAIGRVLHVPVKDVEVMLKKYDQLET